ncbi:MAG TPA: MarR family transcriptional regulator [Thermoanaerobaculia bacterium]|jgi:DNA-binding transcriptional regulator GbsR (MarR family)
MNKAGRPPADLAFYVEEWGLLFEQSGLPRMAGRVLGWLLVCDPVEQNTAGILEALSASKGSISTTLGLLERFRLIERVGRPGDRRTYFRIAPGAFARMMEDKLRSVTTWKDLAERGIELLRRSGRERTLRLQGVRDFYAFFEREFPALIRQWRRENEK